MVSLDVVSLFTNIPIDLALNSVDKKWKLIKDYTNLPKNEFILAAKLCLNSTYFQYNDKIYKQIFGTAMGSPLSAVIANLVMEDLEQDSLNKLDCHVQFYKRYIDDCICCIPVGKIDHVPHIFNSYHGRLKFTFETESQNSINFLNVKIIHNNTHIKTNWHIKDTSSNRHLNYFSYTSVNFKKSVINSLVDQTIKLAHPKFIEENLSKVKSILEQNSYPKEFYDKLIKKRINKKPISVGRICSFLWW